MLLIKMAASVDGETMVSEEGVTFEDVYKCAANGEPVMLFVVSVDGDVARCAHYPLITAAYAPAESELPAEITAVFFVGSGPVSFTGQPGQVLGLERS